MKAKLLIFFLLIITSVHAQPFRIQRLGIESGLSNNFVMGITQDRQGFIWISTESGLNRFDGQKFRVYKKHNFESKRTISGDELNIVYADKFDDKIWVATQRDGLIEFNCVSEKFQFYTHDPEDSLSLPTNDITDVINASDGNLWITTYSNGFSYFNKTSQTFTNYNQNSLPGLVSNQIWTIAEAQNGEIYLGHENSGLTIYSPQSNTIKNFRYDPQNPLSLPGDRVNKIFIDYNQNIWVGTNNGLALYDRQNETFTNFRHEEKNTSSLLANFIYDITQTHDKKLWIGTENGGISILSLQQSLFSKPQEIVFENIEPGDDPYSLSNKTIRSIFEDSFNNIWVGTYGGGLNFISHQAPYFSQLCYTPGEKNSLTNKTAWGIAADEKGRIWVGTDGGGINVFDKDILVESYNKTNSALTDDAILSAFRDSKGNIWFGTFKGGVMVRKADTKKLRPFPISNISDIRCITEDVEGNIWFGGSTGIHIYKPSSGQIQNYTVDNSALRGNLVRSICQDENGNMWIGFFGEGVAVYKPTLELIKYFDKTNGLPSNMVNHIFKDYKNTIWVGTSDGLIQYPASNIDHFKILTRQDGLADSHVRAITEDARGNLWLSTTSGIAFYDQTKKQFFNYSHKNYTDLPIGSFMGGSVLVAPDKTILFGSQNGLCRFNPNILPSNLQLPPTAITDFKIFNKKVLLSEEETSMPINKTIQLNYNQNTFRISFSVLDYALSDLVEFSYKLDGLENRWYKSDDGNAVTFRNIPYGQYKFEIRSNMRNQASEEQTSSMIINIAPPIFLSWWAKLLYIFLIISVLFVILRFYKRKIQLENSLVLEKKNLQQEHELNMERLRFFTNITHELRTPLTLILGPLEDLISEKSLTSRQTLKLSNIQKSANRLLSLINQILEFRKTETQNKKLSVRKAKLDVLIREIWMKYKELNSNEEVIFELEIEKSNYEIYFDAEVITIIMDNLISNAIKYCEKGYIRIHLRNLIEGNIVFSEITVSDTGRGIHPESLPYIFDRYYQARDSFQKSGTGIGLALAQNLAKLHAGQLTASSIVGKGSTFTFRIDKEASYSDAIIISTEESPRTESTPKPKESNTKDHSRPIILVVDDNKEINDYIVETLSEIYIVHSAYDGRSGLEKAFEIIPDVIVCDVMMPKLDGFEVTQQLKKDIRTSHIPLILLTAKDTIEDKTEGYELGAESYITKPFSGRLLLTRIQNILNTRKMLAEQFGSKAFKTDQVSTSLSTLDREFIKQVQSVIETNIDSDKLDVNFIADHLAMSYSSLYRKIKALTDMTINEYIRVFRIRKAEELLITGRYSISEVSFMVGMSSMNHFRKSFKEEFGMLPSDYIKSITSKLPPDSQ